MTTSILVRTVAKSDKEVFIAVSEDGEFCVFSLEDANEIQLGDKLIGDFHGHSSGTFEANNLTRKNSPWIVLEDWETTIDLAIDRLLVLRTPKLVETSKGHVPTDSPNVRELIHTCISHS